MRGRPQLVIQELSKRGTYVVEDVDEHHDAHAGVDLEQKLSLEFPPGFRTTELSILVEVFDIMLGDRRLLIGRRSGGTFGGNDLLRRRRLLLVCVGHEGVCLQGYQEQGVGSGDGRAP